MPEINSQDLNLLTLRISVQFKDREPHVQIRACRGQRELAAASIPAADIGIKERLSVSAYRYVKFDLPEDAISPLDQALKEVRQDEPVWLQIDYSAGFLAVVPWERLLSPVVGGPILRLPISQVDSPFVEGPLALIMCASAPAAKEFYPVYDFTIEVIRHIQQAVTQGTEIHVFADQFAYHDLQKRFGKGESPHRVIIYDPEAAADFGTGSSEISESEKLRSPWLRWMETKTGGRPIDAVHFVCPGYFQDDRGSLALARSPLDNQDPNWAHFVSGAELSTFLNNLGAGATVLGSPYENIWALGLRLLANELASTRIGPVMLYETQANLNPAAQAYSFLFSETYSPPPQRGEILLYCHPRRLERWETGIRFCDKVGRYLGAHKAGFADRPSGIKKGLCRFCNKIGRYLGGVRTGFPEAPATEPRWMRTNRQMIEQARLDLSGQQGAAADGTAKAIHFLSDLQKKYQLEKE